MEKRNLDHCSGTSPRTRGKLGQSLDCINDRGNIPAHAGKTYAGPNPAAAGEEHPRARGENSKPFTRQCEKAWNIPAHAGKTRKELSCYHVKEEHPRARGENLNPSQILGEDSGTSPRTRGKRVDSLEPGKIDGNIPAHAGKTRVAPA